MTTTNKDMVIYDDLAQTAYLERMQDVLEVFNGASNGAFDLSNENIVGDFRKRAFYKIGGAIEHRDVNSEGRVDTKKVGASEMVGVKVPFKYGPYSTSEEAFKRRSRDPEEFSVLLGQDYADAVLTGYIQYSTAALQAAISGNKDMVAKANIAVDGRKTLTKGLRMFGDRFNRIAIWVMDSNIYFDIVDEAIAAKIYEEAGLVIYGGVPGTLGKPVLVTDQSPPDVLFGLQRGAININESQLPGFRSYPINDGENLEIGFRAEGVFNMDVMGYSWKETAGANPNLATVGSSASWLKHATSNKSTAGVVINLTRVP